MNATERKRPTGNASSFKFPRTRIVVYSDANLAVAQRIRTLLGLGDIEIGRTRDLTRPVDLIVENVPYLSLGS